MSDPGPTYPCDQHGEPRWHPIAYRCPEWAAALEARVEAKRYEDSRLVADLVNRAVPLRAKVTMLEAALEKSAVLTGLMRERAEKAEHQLVNWKDVARRWQDSYRKTLDLYKAAVEKCEELEAANRTLAEGLTPQFQSFIEARELGWREHAEKTEAECARLQKKLADSVTEWEGHFSAMQQENAELRRALTEELAIHHELRLQVERQQGAMTPPDDIREWVWSPRTKGWWALARPIGTRDALAIDERLDRVANELEQELVARRKAEAENERLRAGLEKAALNDIASRNPGIDIEEVARHRQETGVAWTLVAASDEPQDRDHVSRASNVRCWCGVYHHQEPQEDER